jgi:hypothetical protein
MPFGVITCSVPWGPGTTCSVTVETDGASCANAALGTPSHAEMERQVVTILIDKQRRNCMIKRSPIWSELADSSDFIILLARCIQSKKPD